MLLSLKQLLHRPVETKSGTALGEVADIEINPETHLVIHYVVKSAFVPRPFAKEFIIAPAQVVSISKEKMIVEDGVLPAGTAVPTPAG